MLNTPSGVSLSYKVFNLLLGDQIVASGIVLAGGVLGPFKLGCKAGGYKESGEYVTELHLGYWYEAMYEGII